MGTPVNERVRAYRQRQAELRGELKKLGLQTIKLIAVEPAFVGLERVTQATADLYLKRPSEIGDDHFERHEQDLLGSFLKSGSPQMVEFRMDGIGAMGVKMIPWRSTPVLCTFKISGRDIDQNLFLEQFPLLRQVHDFIGYHWRTPEYIRLCQTLGIDPLYHAPEFHIDYDELGWSLLDWDVEWFERGLRQGEAYYAVRNFVFDILDLLRVDEHRSKSVAPPEALRELKSLECHLKHYAVPHIEQVYDLLENPGKLSLRGMNSMVGATITFLPSPFGTGYCASISGWYGDHAPDGWIKDYYDGLHGIAVMPSDTKMESQPWLKTVVEHLRTQGVIFLRPDQVTRYMEGEGAYWKWRNGWTHDTPVTSRVLWSVRRPSTPLGDRAIELADAGRLLKRGQT